jgi:N-carbamoylputrescine amidase
VPANRPDVICLPEAFTARGVPTRSVADVAEPVPGPTTDALAGLARAYGCYVVCPIYTRRDGRFFNSAVLIDRGGAIAGIYDKARPCLTADGVFEEGVMAGE